MSSSIEEIVLGGYTAGQIVDMNPAEQIVLGGWAITGVHNASEQRFVSGGFVSHSLIHALLAFAAATRRWTFERVRR